MDPSRFSLKRIATVLPVLVVVLSSSGQAQVLLRDDFGGNALDMSVWCIPEGRGSFFGRTQIRPPCLPPEVSGGVLRLELHSHNPYALVPGDSFWGSEIETIELFTAENGLAFKTRMRFVETGEDANGSTIPLACGLTGGFFGFSDNDCGQWSLDVRDEIDFELLSNDVVLSPQERVLTNIFFNDDFSQAGRPAFADVAGLDLTEFHEFEVRWWTDRVEWYVNGERVRQVDTEIPDEPLSVRANLWAPDDNFVDAYCDTLQPTPNASENEIFYAEVDYIEIRECGAATLDASPEVVVTGQELYLTTCGGEPGQLQALFAIAPVTQLIQFSAFGQNGVAVVSGPVPPGLSGTAVTFLSFVSTAAGIEASNPEIVFFEYPASKESPISSFEGRVTRCLADVHFGTG